jgi:hypothetical protein
LKTQQRTFFDVENLELRSRLRPALGERVLTSSSKPPLPEAVEMAFEQ